MAGRFALFVMVLTFASSGCATVSEDRLTRLEAAVADMQTQEIRIAILEDKVGSLVLPTSPDQGRAADQASAPGRTVPSPSSATSSAVGKNENSRAMPQTTSVPAIKKQPQSPAQTEREYQKALAALDGGRPLAALGLFRDFLQAHPEHALAPNAGYWLGECHYTLKDFDAAIAAFKDVVAQYPAHDKAAAAMLKAGYSYALLGDTANARFYLEALLRDYPASRPAPLARARIATL